MSPPQQIKAALLGAAGGIGQPLALLLKQNQLITHLSLFDVVPVVKGVAVDISHINTTSQVTAHVKGEDDGLKHALEGANIVIIPAGVPRKPGMTRDDLFNINASIVAELAQGIAQYAPKAFIAVISNPVNSTVPIVAEVLKKAGVFDPKRLFGVTTLDVVRASQFTAEVLQKPTASASLKVPVIGGHSGITILPLLSQASESTSSIDQESLDKLINRIQFGGDEVVKAKDGGGSATLSMAYAGFRFAESVLSAAYEGKSVEEYAYVLLESDPEGAKSVVDTLGSKLAFFSVPVKLGPNGVEAIKPIGKLSEHEQKLLQAAVPELEKNIDKGVSFAKSKL